MIPLTVKGKHIATTQNERLAHSHLSVRSGIQRATISPQTSPQAPQHAPRHTYLTHLAPLTQNALHSITHHSHTRSTRFSLAPPPPRLLLISQAMILSAAMMLRYDLGRAAEADLVEQAVDVVMDKGYATADIEREGTTPVGCKEMGDKVKEELAKLVASGSGVEAEAVGAAR